MTIISVLKFVHVVAGTVSLAALGIPLLSRKGGPLHRRAGWIYAAAIGVIVATTWILCALRLFDPDRSNDAMTLVMAFLGLLTANAVVTGLRVLRAKERAGRHTNPFDIGSSAALGLASLALGGYAFQQGSGLFTALAAIGGFRAGDQIRYWLRPPGERMHWWQEHLANMVTSGIAALTAFLLLFVSTKYSLNLWLAPGVVGGAGIILWQRYYRRKFATAG
jgi:hypothetical protein